MFLTEMHSFEINVPPKYPGLEKTSRISEFSGGRLFEKIEWGPPLKTEKLLWVMKKNRESKDRMGRLPFYPAYRCQAESRIEGRLPFYLVKKAALKGRLPIPILSCQKGGPCGAATILSWQKDKTRNILKKSDFLSHSILSKKAAL